LFGLVKQFKDLVALKSFLKVLLIECSIGVYVLGRLVVLSLLAKLIQSKQHQADYAISIARNLVHDSDSVKYAQRENALWFPHGIKWTACGNAWLYEHI